MNHSSTIGRATTAGAPRQRRFGLLALLAGYSAIRLGDDGREAQYTAKEKRLYPEAKVIATCVTCKKDYRDMKAAESAHPAHAVMCRRQEAHVLAYWSEDIDPRSEEMHAAWERTRQLAMSTGQTFADPEPAIAPIGYLSASE